MNKLNSLNSDWTKLNNLENIIFWNFLSQNHKKCQFNLFSNKLFHDQIKMNINFVWYCVLHMIFVFCISFYKERISKYIWGSLKPTNEYSNKFVMLAETECFQIWIYSLGNIWIYSLCSAEIHWKFKYFCLTYCFWPLIFRT